MTAAIATVAGAQHAGATLIEKGKLVTVALSDPWVRTVDEAQYDSQQGPCVDTILKHHTYRTGHLASETARWPRFTAPATELGVESIPAFRLFTTETTLAR